ncbi:MAG: type I secretion system permease/ATPase, partial [Rhizobacter sp.]|nr:type I secretion system permease/ATPase [Rhizobacter sp.]
MTWLFAASLRPFMLLAAAASLVLNLALLVPSIYTLQVFDRVFASRSVETLVMLSIASALALLLAYAMDTARARALSWAGRLLDERLSPPALAVVLRQAAASGRADRDALRDIAQLRSFLGGTSVHALFDAPWLPLYLLLIGLMHPVLGMAATLGALALVGLGVLTERLTRPRAEAALQANRKAGQAAQALTRHAEVIVGMGMTSAALAHWQSRQTLVLGAQDELAAVSRRLAAVARI